MFLEFSQHKLLIISLIVGLIISCTGVFLFANGAFALIAHSEEYLAMNQSSFWYWLFYELPRDNTEEYAAADVPAGSAHSIPVLLYHGEGATSNMPLSVFVDQLQALKDAGWHTITMAQFQAFMEHGTPLPAKSFLLTFDDGRKDTYYQADPVLKDMGFNAVMFVITGFSLPTQGKESDFYLNKTELADMVASGRWELESHGDLDHATYAVQSTTDLSQTATTTDGHFLSNKFWSESADRFETTAEFSARVSGDLQTSKQTLQQDFGINVSAFAYPFNDYGQDSVNFPGSTAILDGVIPSIYQFAFYQTWTANGDTFNYPEVNNGPGTSEYMVKRIEPLPTWSGTDLIGALNAGAAKPLPYQSATFEDEWVGTWGTVAAQGGSLALSAKPTTSGASAFLNGSRWWTNYMETATLDWNTGDVSLVARNEDDAHYLTCTFDKSDVSIEWHAVDSHTTLASADVAAAANSSLGMAVYGDTTTCYENGIAVVSARSSEAAREGGIGIEIWDPELGKAAATLQNISVRPLSAAPALPIVAASVVPQTIAARIPAPPIINPNPPLTPNALSASVAALTPQISTQSSPFATTAATSTRETFSQPFRNFMNEQRNRARAKH